MKKSSRTPDSIFCIAKEMIPDHGEDSFYYDSEENEFVVAALDGCGGSGSKKYENFSGKTGAYVASRAVCGGVKSWFCESREDSELINFIVKSLDVCKGYADKAGRIMGSLGKAFPTTAAIIKGTMTKSGLKAKCFWAGDSRCYMLDVKGLHQLTKDDLDGQDAMSNLLNDGVMTNVISASAPFEIHSKEFTFDYPCIVFAATDGCFGYLNSPMEFEHLLLVSLVNAKNPYEWHKNLYDRMNEVAGDDFTLCVAVCGFKDFESLKNYYSKRIGKLAQMLNSGEDPVELWKSYKKSYSME